VLRAELHKIAELLQDYRLVQSKVYGMPGETVRITRGSLKNLEGRITRQIPGSNRFVLAISFLGLSVEVEVADRAVQKVF
jgi:transcription antitermination factor NusG